MKVFKFSYGSQSQRIHIPPVLHSFTRRRSLKSNSIISFPINIGTSNMKKSLVFGLLFFTISFLSAQSRDEKLQQLKNRRDIKVTEVEPNLLKLEYPNGKILYKNIADYQPQTSNHQLIFSPTYDSTIIDLRFIDTTQYYHMYSYWTEVPIHNWNFD